jgi:hypothetical protein
VSHAALDRFAAPVFACDDEAGEKAAAKTKRAESHHDDELQWFTHRNISLQLGDVRRDPAAMTILGVLLNLAADTSARLRQTAPCRRSKPVRWRSSGFQD